MTESDGSFDCSAFCRKLPKVELHAHLHGSIRQETFLELSQQHGIELDGQVLVSSNLSEALGLFNTIHQAVSDVGIVRRVTREIVEDFAVDGCVLLELRTSLKRSMGKGLYLAAVLAGLNDARNESCIARLILSIDRREDFQEAQETIDLALSHRDVIVGVDLAGDPSARPFSYFLPLFRDARRQGLSVTLHAGEVDDESELDDIVAFGPDRLGHLIYSTPAQNDSIARTGTPLEMCLTSNRFTTSLQPGDHHFSMWLRRGTNRLAICTDDRLIFRSSLSNEHAIVMSTFGLSTVDMVGLTRQALSASFADVETKALVEDRIETFLRNGV